MHNTFEIVPVVFCLPCLRWQEMFDTHHCIHYQLPICNAHHLRQHLGLRIHASRVIISKDNSRHKIDAYLVFGLWYHSFAEFELLVKHLMLVMC